MARVLLTSDLLTAIITSAPPANDSFWRDDPSMGGVAGLMVRKYKTGRVSFILEGPKPDGRTYRVTVPVTPLPDRKGAQKALGDARAWASQHRYADPMGTRARVKDEARTRRTVADHWQTYLDTASLKDSTRADYVRLGKRYILPEFGAKTLEEITRKDVRDWHAQIRDGKFGINPKTSLPYKGGRYAGSRAVAVLKAFVKFSDEDLPNPADCITQGKTGTRDGILTDVEAQRLDAEIDKAIADGDIGALLIRAIWMTGAQPSEWTRARWDQIVIGIGIGGKRELRLTEHKTSNKVDDARIIIIPDDLWQQLDVLPRDAALIFAGHRDAARPRDHQVPWNRLKEAANLSADLTCYSLRHTVATQLVESLSLVHASAALGHASVATTTRYTHAKDKHRKEAAAALEDLRKAGRDAAMIEDRSKAGQ